MARQRYVYREDRSGRVRAIPVRGKPLKRDDQNEPFDQRMLKAYYDLECRDGSRFYPGSVKGYGSAQKIKEAWSN